MSDYPFHPAKLCAWLFKTVFFTSAFAVFYQPSLAQGTIYFGTEQKKGIIVEINAEKLKYNNPENPGPLYSITLNKKVLAFNAAGSFLIAPKPDSCSQDLYDRYVNSFVAEQNDSTGRKDKIYTIQKKLLICDILNEDATSFLISINEVELKLDKSAVACVVYRGGHHQLIAAVPATIEVLGFFQSQQIDKFYAASKPVPATERQDQPNKTVNNVASTAAEIKPAPQELGTAKKTTSADSLQEAEKLAAASAAVLKAKRLQEEKQEALLLERERKAKADSLLKRKELEAKYAKLLSSGDAQANRKNYEGAQLAYSQAALLKPDNLELQHKIAQVNAQVDAIQKAISLSKRYDSMNTLGDSLLVARSWKPAIAAYQLALDIRPDEPTPKSQIKYIQSEILREEQLEAEEKEREEIRKKKELQRMYDDALLRAENAVRDKKYQEALDAYNQADSIHPGNEYIQARKKIMAHQISLTNNPQQQ